MDELDVLVIGAGVTGLAAAWWLTREGKSVVVWEAAAQAGGKIGSTQQDGYLTERAASMVLNFRPEVNELLRQSGLEQAKTARRREAEANRYVLHRGQLQPVPMRLGALLRSPLWSLRGKLRMFAEPLVLTRGSKGESVSAFITRRLGKEVLDKAIEPFIAGTLAADPDQTCAAAALPRLTALERRFGSLAAGVLMSRIMGRNSSSGTEVFSFRGGMNTLVEGLLATGRLRLETRHNVQHLARERGGWRVSASTPQGERSVWARQLVLATPAANAAGLLLAHDAELARLLQGIEYASVALVHLGFARQTVGQDLNATGFLAPRAESPVLTGNLWASTLFPDRAPAGKVLLTSYLGGARAPQAIDWDDSRLIAETLAHLSPLMKLRGEPEMLRVERQHAALPLYHGAYQARMQALAARLKALPGLHLEASYREGVSVRDRIVRGYGVARAILAADPPSGAARGGVSLAQQGA